MNNLFEKSGSLTSELYWYTWAYDIRKMLESISMELSSLNTVLSNISPDEQYGFTYIIEKNSCFSKELCEIVSYISDLLIEIKPPHGIILLTNLVSEKLPADALHTLFSMIAAEVRKKNPKGNTSLHSPIKSSNQDSGFPVHADLFRAKMLFNVITHKGKEKGGDITLLSAKSLFEGLGKISSIPQDVVDYIQMSLTCRTIEDNFDNVFDLMYGNHPWASCLTDEIQNRQIQIPAKIGTGYLLIDGEWLHGRTDILGEVRKSRLQRLIFDTKETMKKPIFSDIALSNLMVNNFNEKAITEPLMFTPKSVKSISNK